MTGLVTLPFWIYAAYSDYKTRTAPNWVWGCVLIGSLPLIGYGISIGTLSLARVLFSVSLLSFVGLFLYSQNLVGGADAKAFIVLGFAFPELAIPILFLTVVGAAVYVVRDYEPETIPFLVPMVFGIVLSLLWRGYALVLSP